MKRIFALLLCMAMLLPLAGCSTGIPKDHEPIPGVRTVTVAQKGKTKYTIVYSSTLADDSVEKAAALYLQTALQQMTSATFRLMDDSTPADGPEILIGNTNRKVSQQAQAGLSRYAYRITVQGGDITIVGGGGLAIQTAVNAFVSTYLPDYSILSEKQKKTVKLSASVASLY